MLDSPLTIDVLCLGYACYDLIFSVDHHPGPDEKCSASAFISCGGGTAANGAFTVAHLGYRAAFAGYLGKDIYGDKHLEELQEVGVHTDLVVRGTLPTPLSTVLVKPDGQRSLVAYGRNTQQLDEGSLDFGGLAPGAILLDGHQARLAVPLARYARSKGIPTVLDADSVHPGTALLADLVDYLVASEKFALTFTGAASQEEALAELGRHAAAVIITLGERGLVWKNGPDMDHLSAFAVDAVDTTGAGDAFHGAFAAGVAAGKPWPELLRYASAVGALCCTRYGARLGVPDGEEVAALLENQRT